MSSTQPAFGGMFRQLIELGVIEINTEPLDTGILASTDFVTTRKWGVFS
jgi:hypothetical protein